jgi:hypothetical protein
MQETVSLVAHKAIGAIFTFTARAFFMNFIPLHHSIIPVGLFTGIANGL